MTESQIEALIRALEVIGLRDAPDPAETARQALVEVGAWKDIPIPSIDHGLEFDYDVDVDGLDPGPYDPNPDTLAELQRRLTGPTNRYGSRVIKHQVCDDGTTLSVQASETHYCTPRDSVGPYTHVEVWQVYAAPGTRGAPRQWDEKYGDGGPWAYVPIEEVAAFIDQHGGLADAD